MLSQEGAVWWARLTPKANPESVIDRYGKGDTPVAAAQRARERYEHEQESHGRVCSRRTAYTRLSGAAATWFAQCLVPPINDIAQTVYGFCALAAERSTTSRRRWKPRA